MAARKFSMPMVVTSESKDIGTVLSRALGYIQTFLNSYVTTYDGADNNSLPIKKDLVLTEMSAPGVAPANGARLYVKDNGSGKTQLVVIFQSGSEIVLATEV